MVHSSPERDSPPQASGASASAASSGRGPGWAEVLLCLGLTFSGAAAYLLLIDIHWMHRSGAPLIASLALGAFWATRNALRSRRRGIRIASVANAMLLPLGLYAFFVAARLPAPTRPDLAAGIPDITLPDQHGRPVHLPTILKQGPLLLVFYRGHW